jgi:hypothetical protein
MKPAASLTLILTALAACNAPTQPGGVPATLGATDPQAALKDDCTARKGAKGTRPGVDMIVACPVTR